jgi:outer membrane protein N
MINNSTMERTTKNRVPQQHSVIAGLLSLVLFMCFTSGAKAQQAVPVEGGAEQPPTEAGQTDKTPAKATRDAESEAALSDSEDRERGANEDPMSVSAKQLDAKRKDDKKTEPTGFDVYGSIRLRYREQGGETDLQDGGSRIGAEAHWQIRQDYFVFGRYEAGFNLLSNMMFHSEPGEETGEIRDSFFSRLAYVGLDAPHGYVVAGKNWSTYYEVAGLTDRFSGTGASASGTFNAQTDGGSTGTGRADSILQSKLSLEFLPHRIFKPFKLNFQVQHGNSIPFGGGADYGTAVGVSALMTTRNNFTLGVAYNYADIDLGTYPSLRDIGITGSAHALLLGTRVFGDRWYAGLVVSRLENHETTDSGIYFHGWGSEFYGQYQLFDRLWIAGGYNKLKPDSDQVHAGDYRVRYAVLEVRYSIADFRRLVFANARFNDGIQANGTPAGNVYTIGLKWDLSKRGWHRSNQ